MWRIQSVAYTGRGSPSNLGITDSGTRLIKFAEDNGKILRRFSYSDAQVDQMIDYIENFEIFERLFWPRPILEETICSANLRKLLSRGADSNRAGNRIVH